MKLTHPFRARRRARRITARADEVLGTGLFDRGWYEVRAGREFSDDQTAARHYVLRGARRGLSPHPLFEPTADDVPGRPGQDRLLTYLADPVARTTVSPHPVWDLTAYVDEHPDSVEHPSGALGHLADRLTDDTEVDLAYGVDGATRRWGDLRADLESSTRTWKDGARRRARRRRDLFVTEDTSSSVAELTDGGATPHVTFTVVMATWNRARALRPAIASVRDQTWTDWELVVVDDGSTDDTASVMRSLMRSDDRIRYVSREHEGVSAARNAAIAEASGDYVAFLDSDNRWRPELLEVMAHAVATTGAEAAYSSLKTTHRGQDVFRSMTGSYDDLLLSNFIDLNALVVRRDVLRDVGGFDETLRRAVDHDLVLRLARRAPLQHVPYVGLDYSDDTAAADRISVREPRTWNHVVHDKHAVDRRRSGERARPPRDSVVVPIRQKPDEALHVLRRVLRHFAEGPREPEVEFVLVPGPSRWRNWIRYVSLAASFERCRVVPLSGLVSTSLAANYGAAAAEGDRLAVWDMADQMAPETLETFLSDARSGEHAVVQPLQLNRDGTVRALGGARQANHGTPFPFLSGLPPETATLDRPRQVQVPTLWSQTVAIRTDAYLELGGFDPLLLNGYEGADLGLRAVRSGAGTVGVVTGARSVFRDTQVPRWRADAALNELIMHERYREHDDDVAERFGVLGLQVAHWRSVTDVRQRPHSAPMPVLVRRRSPAPDADGPPSLRWSIKTAAPVGPLGDVWGDTHFALSLARGLRSHGQDATVDRRQAHYRGSAYLDDVNLVLRGLDRVAPDPARFNVLWVISHPDLVTRAELEGYDLVYAASESWAANRSSDWDLPIRPLLQCTDATLFDVDAVGVESDDRSLLFVGNSRKVNRPSVRVPVGHGIDVEVHGPNWEPFIDAGLIRSTFVENDRLPRMYAASGAVLNDHWDDMYREGFVSNRIFDAVAVGARVFSDDLDGLEALFGASVRTWRSEREMVELMQAPLVDTFPDRRTRQEIARHVRDHHSFEVRARQMLDDVVKSGVGR